MLLAGALSGAGGLAMLLVPLWFVVASVGCVMPNTPALALTRHGESAGTAAAMLGAAQFVIGGMAAPLVGAFGDGSAVPMGAVMTGALLLAGILAAHRRPGRSDRARAGARAGLTGGPTRPGAVSTLRLVRTMPRATLLVVQPRCWCSCASGLTREGVLQALAGTPSRSSNRARLGPRVACSSRAPASASRITRSTLPPASLARSASDQPRSASAANSLG